MDPILAARLARQLEKCRSGESSVEHVTSVANKTTKLEPSLAKRLSEQHEKAADAWHSCRDGSPRMDPLPSMRLVKPQRTPETERSDVEKVSRACMQKGAQMDPVLAMRLAKQQRKLETGESDVENIGSRAEQRVELDPLLACRLARQRDKADTGKGNLENQWPATNYQPSGTPIITVDPTLAKRLAEQREKVATGRSAVEHVGSTAVHHVPTTDPALAKRLAERREKLDTGRSAVGHVGSTAAYAELIEDAQLAEALARRRNIADSPAEGSPGMESFVSTEAELRDDSVAALWEAPSPEVGGVPPGPSAGAPGDGEDATAADTSSTGIDDYDDREDYGDHESAAAASAPPPPSPAHVVLFTAAVPPREADIPAVQDVSRDEGDAASPALLPAVDVVSAADAPAAPLPPEVDGGAVDAGAEVMVAAPPLARPPQESAHGPFDSPQASPMQEASVMSVDLEVSRDPAVAPPDSSLPVRALPNDTTPAGARPRSRLRALAHTAPRQTEVLQPPQPRQVGVTPQRRSRAAPTAATTPLPRRATDRRAQPPQREVTSARRPRTGGAEASGTGRGFSPPPRPTPVSPGRQRPAARPPAPRTQAPGPAAPRTQAPGPAPRSPSPRTRAGAEAARRQAASPVRRSSPAPSPQRTARAAGTSPDSRHTTGQQQRRPNVGAKISSMLSRATGSHALGALESGGEASSHPDASPNLQGGAELCLTTGKAPTVIMQELQRSAMLQRAVHRKVSNLLLRCEKQAVRFEVEISRLPGAAAHYVVRCRRLAGGFHSYKELCARVLAEAKL
mmetsp:Transcript_45953/g.142257  ORF Transcript_45953/g.142257 Transcript_45953/m.142257 type:complete len:796 (-) Transcript_45953:110-2497(-)